VRLIPRRLWRDHANGAANLPVCRHTRGRAAGPSGSESLHNLIGERPKGAIADKVIFMEKDAGSGVFTIKCASTRGPGFADINLLFDEASNRVIAPAYGRMRVFDREAP
jgi:hypothetical protein